MKLNRRVKRFHDPWGHRKDGELHGSAWLVGTEVNQVWHKIYYVDRVRSIESDMDRYVLAKHSIEKVRR